MIEDDPMAVDQFTAAVLKVAGPDGLVKMRAIAGGTEICLSLYPRDGTIVVRALGMEDARKIYDELRVSDANGRPMPFPRFYLSRGDTTYAKRQIEVLKLAKEGKTGNETAIALGISVRALRKHIARLRASGELPKALPRSADHSANVGEMVAPPSGEVSP